MNRAEYEDYVTGVKSPKWNIIKIIRRAQARAYHWAYEHNGKDCWCQQEKRRT